MARGLAERFGFVTAGFTPGEWLLLGAIALERELSATAVAELSYQWKVPLPYFASGDASNVTKDNGAAARLAQWHEQKLLSKSSQQRSFYVARQFYQEFGYQVKPEYRQLALRHLVSSGQMPVVAQGTSSVLGERSVARLQLVLQAGRFEELPRAAWETACRPGSLENPSFTYSLRESVCEPFDGHWFTKTWGERAMRVATQCANDALFQLDPIDNLFEWLRNHNTASDSPVLVVQRASKSLAKPPLIHEYRSSPSRILVEHALLSGDTAAATQFSQQLPSALKAAAVALQELQAGAVETAVEAASTAAAFVAPHATRGARSKQRTGTAPDLGGLTPWLCLLLISAHSTDGLATAELILQSQKSFPHHNTYAKGLRAVLNALEHADEPEPPPDVHQFPKEASALDLFLHAFAVHLSSATSRAEPSPAAAAWVLRLEQAATTWYENGYLWMARQAWALAVSLRDVHGSIIRQAAPSFEAGTDIHLCTLVEPKPTWEKALDALSALSETTALESPTPVRLCWMIDLVHLRANKPLLQRWNNSTGWDQGRRVALSTAYSELNDLPPEDQKALGATETTGTSEARQSTPDTLEALVAHPRVMNAADPSQSLDIVQGVCQVKAETQDGLFCVEVEPETLHPGLHIAQTGPQRISVYRITSAFANAAKIVGRGLTVPAANKDKALAMLGRLAQTVTVHCPDFGTEEERAADPTPCLRVVPEGGNFRVELGVRPFGARGRFFPEGAGPLTLSAFADGKPVRFQRSAEAEKEGVQRVLTSCPTLNKEDVEHEPPHAWDMGEMELLELLSDLRNSGEPHHMEWPTSKAPKLHSLGKARSLTGKLRRNKAWYLVEGSVQLDKHTQLDLADLAASAYSSPGRFVRLPNGDYIEVEKRVRRVLDALRTAQPTKGKSNTLQLHQSAVEALEALTEEDSEFERGEELSEWLARVAEIRDRTYELPNNLNAELRDYQVEGYHWMRRLADMGIGACLADDMGLGKTVQIIALLLSRADTGPTLVCAPTSVCRNWALELTRFGPSLSVVEYGGKNRDKALANLGNGDVLITSYGLLQNDAKEFGAIEWGTSVLDEAQFIKNPHTLRAKAAFKIDAKFRIAATGTPIENHLGDLWSLFRFLSPELLGPWKAFSSRFVTAIERQRDIESKAHLKKLLTPYILRRTKKEVLKELPALTVVNQEVELSPSERRRYEGLRQSIYDRLKDNTKNRKFEVLSELTRLRRFCCHPKLVFPDASESCAKLDAFVNLVDELLLNDHRALVFSQYVDFLTLVRERLEELGIGYQYLDGSASKTKRAEEVEAFQEGKNPLFLISLKAGGFGLNLTNADYVVHLDPWWNPAVEQQATDRAHRIGQTMPVTVYRLIIKETIEESILKLHAHKKDLANTLLSDSGEAGRLSTDELLNMIQGERINAQLEMGEEQ